ncbi:MAG: AlkA N-terminal domain-containing protein [Nevskia sp.]|nr:AlkA N-terminal domain-containing protein [Nevskia sp.]
MPLDADLCYHRLSARDTRFDGQFFVGVTSTGVYCRPICPVRLPRRDRCRFFSNAAAAEREGFRPCLRCRPELAPGQAPVDAVSRIAARAVARIEAGALNEAGLEALAAELQIGERQLRRAIEREYGVAPVELAQTQRLLMAKRLLTDTRIKVADVAFASGFSSLRRFNHLFRTRYGFSPTALRRRAAPQPDGETVTLKLAYRPPLDWDALLAFLVGRGAAGVEEADGGCYLRAVRIGGHAGWITAQPAAGEAALRVEVAIALLPVLTPLLARLRRLFDLDANPQAIAEHLSRDPRLRGSLESRPGLRVPGSFDGFELALRAVLGQQVSVKAATTLFGRFCRAYGEALDTPHPLLTHSGPQAERIAAATLDEIAALGLPGRRAATVQGLARAVSERRLRLEPGPDPAAVVAGLQELPGIGDWTAQYVAMRALRDPDAFPASDLGIYRSLNVSKPRDALAAAEAWRPWRAYATMHLWQGYGAGG